MKNSIKSHLVFIASLLVLFALSACISFPKSFQEDGKVVVHGPSGIKLPKKIKGWNLIEGTAENVDENIGAIVPYQAYSFKKGSSDGTQIPTAAIFIVTTKSLDTTALIQERMAGTHNDFKELRKEEFQTNQGIAKATVFGYQTVIDPLPEIKLVAQKVENEAWLVTLPSQSHLVFWITFDKKDKSAVLAPQDFIKAFSKGL